MSTSIEDLTASAKQLIADRRYQDAVRACRRVLLSRPAMTEVRILLGMALLALRRHDEVRAEMMAVIRSAPEEAAAHRLLGEAHLRDGQVDKARASLKRALELNPADDEALDLLGEVAGEDRPQTETIDRWFDPEAVSTVQTDAPDFDDDATAAVGKEVVDEAIALIAGAGDSDDPMERTDEIMGEATLAVPPDARREPVAPPRAAPPRSGPRSSYPPPRPQSAPPPPHRRAPSGFPPQPPPAPTPPRPAPPSYRSEAPTFERGQTLPFGRAGGPEPVQPLPEGTTDPISLVEVDAPTRSARPLPFHPPPAPEPFRKPQSGYPAPPAPPLPPPAPIPPGEPADFADEHQTWARPSDLDVDGGWADALDVPEDPDDFERTEARQALPELEAEQTMMRQPSSAPPGFAPAPAAVPSSPVPTPSTSHSRGVTTVRPARGEAKSGRRRGLIAAFVLGPLLTAGIGVVVGRSCMASAAEKEILAAAEQATDDGRGASLERAIALAEAHDDDEGEGVALRARLVATAVLEQRADRGTEVETLLAEVGEAPEARTDVAIARAYLALARGNPERAWADLASLPADAPVTAELSHARAVAGLMTDGLNDAAEAAARAVAARPTAPRHVALHATVLAAREDTQQALDALHGVPDGASSPAVRVTRAQILMRSGRDPSRAEQEATAVLTTLADAATPVEKAWAHLIRAERAGQDGDAARAASEAREARDLRPPGDELFALALAKALLDAGEKDDAWTVIDGLPDIDLRREERAELRAEIALARGQLGVAERALERAGDGARAELLRGRVREARGNFAEARAAYERAIELDRSVTVVARTRLGAIAMRQNDLDRAIEQLRLALATARSHPEVVSLLVDALLRRDRVDEAGTVVRNALADLRERGGGEPAWEIVQADARVALARGDFEDAIESLQVLVRRRPRDASTRVALGDAQRSAGDADAAGAAYREALEIRETERGALVGLALLALATFEVTPAREAVDRARAGGVDEATVAELDARVGVVEGKGAEVIERLTTAVGARRDADLWVALGLAQFQAEADRDAARSFQRALRIDRGNPEALLGLAQIVARGGAPPRAVRAAEAARAAGEDREVTPWFEARVLAVLGRVAFELGRYADTIARAEEATRLDPRTSEAHMLLALVAETNGEDMRGHLREAVQGRMPPPEALGLLAKTLGSGPEACDLARRYVAAAPNGFDAPDVATVLRGCR